MKRFFVRNILFALGIILLTASSAMADSPWIWKITLQQVNERDQMLLPTGFYPDMEKQRYYVVDSGRNRLLSFDRNGEFLSGFTADNQLQTPFDLVREAGILWVSEKGKNSVTMIDLEAKKVAPRNIVYQGKKVFPDRLEIEKDTLYVLDKATGSILALDKNMEVMNRLTCGDCAAGFVDFKVKGSRIWALEQQEKAVYVFSMDGKTREKIELAESGLEFPRSLAVDEADVIYVLDRHKGNISVFDSRGQYKYSFLEQGQARGQLYYPIEIQFDPWGHLCVVDEGNGRIQIYGRN